MDKFYLAKTIASDRKKESDHDLMVRHLLKGKNAVIVISILAILVFKLRLSLKRSHRMLSLRNL